MHAAAQRKRKGKALEKNQSKEIRRKRPKGLVGLVDLLHHEVPEIAAIYQCTGCSMLLCQHKSKVSHKVSPTFLFPEAYISSVWLSNKSTSDSCHTNPAFKRFSTCHIYRPCCNCLD